MSDMISMLENMAREKNDPLCSHAASEIRRLQNEVGRLMAAQENLIIDSVRRQEKVDFWKKIADSLYRATKSISNDWGLEPWMRETCKSYENAIKEQQ